ncbi:hypothetical protein JVU11DRAFT_6096 [Chiua virens]|nr:hypothetical protein JVU11DRAFT_6096 [Chiua virens]
MFGCCVAGRLLQTNLQQVDETHALFEIPAAEKVNHVCVFLLGTIPFPEGYGATVHFFWPGRGSRVLGMLSNEKPSAVFRLRSNFASGSNPVSGMGTPSAFISAVSTTTGEVTATLGFAVEPLEIVAAQMAALPTTTLNAETTTVGSALTRQVDTGVLADRIARHLLNYISGFVPSGGMGPESMVPMGVIAKCVAPISSNVPQSAVNEAFLVPIAAVAVILPNPTLCASSKLARVMASRTSPGRFFPLLKQKLINRLGRTGLRNIEAGSFVSPKWVPQMAGTAEVLSLIDPVPNTDLSVLVPNGKGLDELFRVLSTSISPDSAAKPPPPVTEVAIFTAATDAFSRVNTNATISESLARLEPVARAAHDKGLKVRGYISVVVTCPYSGRVDPRIVRDISRELIQMGCYEVSLGDTTGTGTPASVRAVLEEVCKEIESKQTCWPLP